MFLAKYTARYDMEQSVPIITAFFAFLLNFKADHLDVKTFISISQNI